MEAIMDAIKKRAWGSLRAALKITAIKQVKGGVLLLLNALKTWLTGWIIGFAVGFGGYFGLQAAFHSQSFLGGPQVLFFELSPVQIIKGERHENREETQ